MTFIKILHIIIIMTFNYVALNIIYVSFPVITIVHSILMAVALSQSNKFVLTRIANMPRIKKKKHYKENIFEFDNEVVQINNPKLDNRLEKYLESVLKPLNFMETFFFCRKYNIRNGKITPNSVFYNALSVTFSFLLMLACGYYIFTSPFTIQMEGYQYFLQWCRIIFFCLLFTSTFLNCSVNNLRSNKICLLVLKLQNVYKVLKMSDDIKSLAFSNWCYIVILHVFHVSWVFYACFFFTAMGAGNNLTGYCWSALDTNLLYAIRTMKLLTLPLQQWVKQINLTPFHEEESWTSMLKAYKDILEAYGIFEETFEILVL